MLLIGMLDSPFVRRVAISMRLLGYAYEHGNWSVGRDFEQIRRYNPLGRVPTLVLDDGVVLCESAAILDWLDEQAGPARALLPPPGIGPARREALQLIALAVGAAEKAREVIYERAFRPAEKHHQPWLDRCLLQMQGSLTEIERRIAPLTGEWLLGARLTQADITLACCYTFIAEVAPVQSGVAAACRALRERTARCETLPEFQATRAAWFAPNSG